MTVNRASATVIAGVFVFVVVGLPYWLVPYASVSLPSSLPNAGLAVLLITAIVLRFYFKASFTQACIVIGLAVPAAIMARVVVEAVRDPTTHNLWPLEVVIGLIIGLSLGCAGAVVGSLLSAVRQRLR